MRITNDAHNGRSDRVRSLFDGRPKHGTIIDSNSINQISVFGQTKQALLLLLDEQSFHFQCSTHNRVQGETFGRFCYTCLFQLDNKLNRYNAMTEGYCGICCSWKRSPFHKKLTQLQCQRRCLTKRDFFSCNRNAWELQEIKAFTFARACCTLVHLLVALLKKFIVA